MEEVKEKKKKSNFKDLAFSVVSRQVEGKKKWYLARIKYDLESATIGDVILEEKEDFGLALESAIIAVEDEITLE